MKISWKRSWKKSWKKLKNNRKQEKKRKTLRKTKRQKLNKKEKQKKNENELTFNDIKNKNIEINSRGDAMANPPALVIEFLCDEGIKKVNLNYIRKSRDKRIMKTC